MIKKNVLLKKEKVREACRLEAKGSFLEQKGKAVKSDKIKTKHWMRWKWIFLLTSKEKGNP